MKVFFSWLRHQWRTLTLLGVFFLCALHTFLFFWHNFLVFKYETLYEEAVYEGAHVFVSENFLNTHRRAKQRMFLSSPLEILRETLILQRGVRDLIHQYKNDVYRMRDTIVQNIQLLRTIADISEEMIYPGREELRDSILLLESRLNMTSDIRGNSLQELLTFSGEIAKRESWKLEQVQKKIVLQDILALKSEIYFLDSVYRTHRTATLVFDKDTFIDQFDSFFTQQNLATLSSELLSKKFSELSTTLSPYRLESNTFRREAREKRKNIVEKEMTKWTESTPPEAPIRNVYDLIYVSLRSQRMYVYEDGDLVLSTPITSGRRDFETVKGTFKVYTKQRNKLMKSPFPDEEYELWVDYWLGFYGAYGIHDACNSKDCWRTRFGGSNYVSNGSHGCVNTPYNAVRFIYNWAHIGTTVHID